MNKNLALSLFIATMANCFFLSFAFADAPTDTIVDQQLALLSPSSSQVHSSSSNSSDSTTDNTDDKNWEYTQTLKYSRGKYGTAQESETYEEDSILQRDFTNGDIYLTIPSLWQTGNVTATSIGTQIIKKKTVHTATNSNISPTITGLGDIDLNGDYNLLQEDKNAPLDVSLTSYIKAPTASSKQGLGTGEWDGGPGLGFAKKIIANIKAIADASYIFDGKATGGHTLNQTDLDGGLEYDITPKITATVKYEYASSATKGISSAEDIYLSLEYKINDDWKINGETTFGLTNGSPDQTYLLGATMSFSGGLLGIMPTPEAGSSTQLDYQTATSPFDLISTRILTDPLYLPLKSQLYGSTAYNFNLAKSSVYNYKGTKTSNSSTDTNTFNQTIGYGLTDQLGIWLTDSYAFNKATKALTTTGALTTSNNEGFNDPTLRTTYRVLDQASFPADLDLSLSISPNAFKDKEAGNGHDGTVAGGDQPVSFATSIGREMKAFTIAGSFTGTYMGNRYYESLANNDNYYIHQYFNYGFAISTQTRLTDNLSFNLGTGYTIVDKSYGTNLSNGTTWIATPANTLDFTGAINYQIIPNRLVGSLTYTYDDFSNSKSTYAALTSDTETKNRYANVFGARADYLF